MGTGWSKDRTFVKVRPMNARDPRSSRPLPPPRMSRSGAAKAAATDPLYKTIAARLCDEIARGDHPVGDLLPTETELCARFSERTRLPWH